MKSLPHRGISTCAIQLGSAKVKRRDESLVRAKYLDRGIGLVDHVLRAIRRNCKVNRMLEGARAICAHDARLLFAQVQNGDGRDPCFGDVDPAVPVTH